MVDQLALSGGVDLLQTLTGIKAGESATIHVAPGVEVDVKGFSPDEHTRLTHDIDLLGALSTQYTVDPRGRHVIQNIIQRNSTLIRLYAMASKNDIQGAGVYNGMNARTGFGMQEIRPDFLVPTAQGRTFDTSVSGLTANNWYGLYQNSAIGGAVSTTALYLRKELSVVLLGMQEFVNPLIDEVQFFIDGKELPIWNIVKQMRATDLPIYEAPQSQYFPPEKQYRSSAKIAVIAGNLSLHPIGPAFVKADWMRTQQPTQPSTTAP